MNIFVVDLDPVVAARSLCDQHVIKMTLESAQILCNAYRGSPLHYRPYAFNHPSTLWACKSRENFSWLRRHGFALAEEYTHRFNKTHASYAMLQRCHEDDLEFSQMTATPFVQLMPVEFRQADPVEAYRAYYRSKMFARWSRNRSAPSWYFLGKEVEKTIS